MARIQLNANGKMNPCPECGGLGPRGRFTDGRLASCCAVCLDKIRACIAKWNGQKAITEGKLPF
jgi:hypothetical protein